MITENVKENEVLDDVGIDGYFDLFGAVVKSALDDYKNIDPNGPEAHLYQSAKNYIFSPRGLEAIIKRIGLDLDIQAIREKAKGRR